MQFVEKYKFTLSSIFCACACMSKQHWAIIFGLVHCTFKIYESSNEGNSEILIFNILQNNDKWMSRSSRHRKCSTEYFLRLTRTYL